MTQKIRILAMVFLTLALMTAGIGGAVAAHAAPTPARLAWSPTTSLGTYDYGTLAVGARKLVTFTLTNAGGKASGRLRITLSGSSAFTITQDGCARSLGPNTSCTVPVAYAPKGSGQSDSATLIASGMSASASLALSGTAGVGGTANLTLSPGTFRGTTNGTNTYFYFYLSSLHVTQTFTVTNNGTSASETLRIECNSASQESCDYPFTSNNDTCTNTSLAANGGSCTVDLDVTFTNNCQEVQLFSTELEVVGNGTNVIYLNLIANVLCPSH